MLWFISAVFLALWLLSMAFPAVGGLAHLFLVAAIAAILVRAWQARTPIR